MNCKPIDRPLVDNTQRQVTKDTLHEEKTWHKVSDDIHHAVEVDIVHQGEHVRVCHMDIPHQNGEFHFVGVGKQKCIFSSMPSRV